MPIYTEAQQKQLEERIAKSTIQSIRDHNEIERLKRALSACESDLKRANSETETCRNIINDLHGRVNTAERERRYFSSKAHIIAEENERLTGEVCMLGIENAENINTIERLESKIKEDDALGDGMATDIQRLRMDNFALRTAQAQLLKDLDIAHERVGELAVENENLLRLNSDLKSEMDLLNDTIDKHKDSAKEILEA